MAGNGYPVVADINDWEWMPSSGREGPCKWLGMDIQLWRRLAT